MSDDLLDRRATLTLDEGALLRLLDLPAGTRVRAIQSEFEPPAILIGVVHPDLPIVEAEVVSPRLNSPMITCHQRVIEGQVYTRSTARWSFGQPSDGG